MASVRCWSWFRGLTDDGLPTSCCEVDIGLNHSNKTFSFHMTMQPWKHDILGFNISLSMTVTSFFWSNTQIQNMWEIVKNLAAWWVFIKNFAWNLLLLEINNAFRCTGHTPEQHFLIILPCQATCSVNTTHWKQTSTKTCKQSNNPATVQTVLTATNTRCRKNIHLLSFHSAQPVFQQNVFFFPSKQTNKQNRTCADRRELSMQGGRTNGRGAGRCENRQMGAVVVTGEDIGKTVVTVGVKHGADMNEARTNGWKREERRQENELEACYLAQKWGL